MTLELSDNPFAGRVPQDLVSLVLSDGKRLEGSYLTVAGLHFLRIRLGGGKERVEGPFQPGDVSSLRLVKSRDEVVEDLRDRKRGEPVRGRLERTRDGYEARLELLARVAARETEFMRRMQIEFQFDEVADEIDLAKTKRKWMLVVARWTLHSNEEPTKIDMCGGDMSSAEKMQRPRPQDFDPDPRVRRARFVWPDHIVSDPVSPPNMIKALRAKGFRAQVSVVGEMREDSAELLVDFPQGRRAGRFFLHGIRGQDGAFAWRSGWEGNGSAADQRRMVRALRSETYRQFRDIVATGLVTLQDRLEKTGPSL